MEKRRVFVERFGEDERPFRREERRRRQDDEPHHRPHGHRSKYKSGMKMTTKLMTSKEELVEYVNKLGEQGHHIDIFKIEDGLYKVVVKERHRFNDIAEDIEIEIEER